MTAKILNGLLWLLGGSTPRNRDELLKLLERTSKHAQNISPPEILMLRNILSLPEIRVEDIMIPHGKVDWLYSNDTFAEVLDEVKGTNHSRYPVIDKESNKVTGILHVKGLVGLQAKQDELILTDKIMQNVRVVPESKRLDAMLREFQHYRLHMMVVADGDSGHPVGVVTIEDVLESIVGAIHDEFDASEDIEPAIKAASGSTWQVAGDTPLTQFNKHFSLSLDAERFDTVGGWIANRLGRLPELNEKLVEGNLRLKITELDQRRVLSLLVEHESGKGSNNG